MDNKIQPSIWNMILYKLKWILEKKSYQRKLMGGNTFKKKYIYIFYLSHLVHSFLTIMPQVLIRIALNVFPCNAPREIPPCMAYPSLAVICTYCQATSIHYLQEGHLLIWPVIRQTHARPQQPSLFGWNQYFFQCIKKCDEAFCIVWANSWYVAKDPIIGDGSTHGDIGTPLTWHSECGPLPNDVPPASPHFTEVEAGFIHKNEFVMCPFSFKLHYSLRKRANS